MRHISSGQALAQGGGGGARWERQLVCLSGRETQWDRHLVHLYESPTVGWGRDVADV